MAVTALAAPCSAKTTGRDMKICVVGAGAIGGYLAVLFAKAGHEVTVIARGVHLAAIREKGLTLLDHDGAPIGCERVRATSSILEAGVQDLVLLTVKAHQVEPIAHELPALFDEETVLVPMQNGIPFWYFQRHGGEHEGLAVETVDPNGGIAKTIDPRRILGCVVYP